MTPIDFRRISTLLAMAAGIVSRERAYSPQLVEEFRAAAHAVKQMADSAAPPAAQLVDALGGAAE